MVEAALMSDMDRFLAKLPPDALKYLKSQQDAGTQLVFKDEPYFSRVRFEPTISVDGSSNATYAFSQGQKVQAFSYGIGGSMAPAGFNKAASTYSLGTASDTNLTTTTGKETNGSDLVYVEEIAIILTPRSEAKLAEVLMAEMHMQAGFNGDTSAYKLGSPIFYPGGAGLYGTKTSKIVTPNLGDAAYAAQGAQTNGLPGIGNVLRLKDPIVWMPKPNSDSTFLLEITLDRAISIVANARTAAAGVVGYTPPATDGAEGTYLEFFVQLRGAQIGPRSRNR